MRVLFSVDECQPVVRVILRSMGWVAPKRDRWVSALQRQGGEVHVAVTSAIVQMSTQFMLHVVMVQKEFM